MPEILFDAVGHPYGTSSGEWFDATDAVILADYTPPYLFIKPDLMADIEWEHEVGLDTLYGEPMPRKSQQDHARRHVADTRGFASVVSVRVHYSTGPKTLVVHEDGRWREE